jgi:hypothetical protein
MSALTMPLEPSNTAADHARQDHLFMSFPLMRWWRAAAAGCD